MKEFAELYRVILVPLDGSIRAEVIMVHVEELAHRYDATVILLQVLEPISPAVEIMGLSPIYRIYMSNFQELLGIAERYLAGWQRELGAKGIEVKSVIETGSVVEQILSVAERENVDVIALASHGRTGLARALYGSVAAGLVHQSGLPLLLIRAVGSNVR